MYKRQAPNLRDLRVSAVKSSGNLDNSLLHTALAACTGTSTDGKVIVTGDTAEDTAADTGVDTADSAADTGSDSGTDTADSAAVDADGDGFPADEDCDDADPNTNPDGTEVCGGGDEDCDGADST